jgi:hypothetical protein
MTTEERPVSEYLDNPADIEPDGCGACGRARRGHPITWTDGVGFHNWFTPTTAQRKERMLARAAAR